MGLGDIFTLSFGINTGDDSRFLARSADSPQHRALLRGEDIHRYSVAFKGEYVWYVPHQTVAHRKTARPGNAERFEQPKVLVRDTGAGLQGTFDNEGYYVKDVLIVSSKHREASQPIYVIGVLNSRLMRFYYETSFPTLHVQRDELASLPVYTIDFTDPADAARHARMVDLVERMLALHKELAAARTPGEHTLLERQVAATDALIDRLVYELCALTEEEIRMVEGQGA
jgi:hypothetical protein